MKFGLTYIIATHNRLPFLKITLEKLIPELRQDEEIVIVDGNSTDGSKEYLQQLFQNGKIHQFISEPDNNQAHAWNKALLMANGIIIKKIIDDDAFCYDAIRECKEYMLLNPTIDVMISNDLGSTLSNYKNIQKHSRLPHFEKWKNALTSSFTFSDVHMLIRRSSLAYLGLYHTAYVMIDWEYSLRISFLQSNIAYYTGYNALSVDHPESVTSLKNSKLTNEQGEKGRLFYDYEGDDAGIGVWSKIKIYLGKLLSKIKARPNKTEEAPIEDLDSIYNYYYDYISELNNSQKFTVLKKV